MAKTEYKLALKGYVGGQDFDRSRVDAVLKAHDGKVVDVLIDSLGGSLATGLSISAAFKNHGDVRVHFVGLNASAATIASLGAKHISIDAGAMYLVHQCSTAFFEWGSLNSSQFGTLIADCEKIKADLDKLDLNCAQLYASRCKRKTEELLALMKVGGWLTAKEALEWGFVDEITDLVEEEAPRLTDALASAMASEGMPIPNIPMAGEDGEGFLSKLLASLTSLFHSHNSISSPTMINPEPTPQAAAEVETSELEARVAELEAAVSAKDAEIAELKARLERAPGADSTAVIDDGKQSEPVASMNGVDRFVATHNSVAAFFNEV